MMARGGAHHTVEWGLILYVCGDEYYTVCRWWISGVEDQLGSWSQLPT